MNEILGVCHCLPGGGGAHIHLRESKPVVSARHYVAAAAWVERKYLGEGRSSSPFHGICACGREATTSQDLFAHVRDATRDEAAA